MTWQFTFYITALLVSGCVSGLMFLVAWRRRTLHGSLAFALLVLSVTEWALTAALEATALDIPTKILWSKIQYVGIVSTPTLFLLFALQYTRQDRWLTPYPLRQALLWTLPVLTLLVAWTNEIHHALWIEVRPTADPHIAEYLHGWWFYIYWVFSIVQAITATLALIWAVIRSPNLYRQQAIALLIGAGMPIVGNTVYIFFNPIPGLDWTPVTFALTGAVLAWGILRFRLFDIVPVARDALIENMRDGVLVLDAQNRLVDLNPAAQELAHLTHAALGQVAETAFAAWPELAAHCCEGTDAQVEISMPGTPRHFELRVSALHDRRGRFTGRLLILHDITQRKLADEKLRQLSRAVEQSPNVVIITDTQGNIEYVNPRFTQVTGYTPEEVRGQNPRILKSGETPPQEYQQMWKTILSGGEWHGVFHNKKKNGELYWESASISPITDAQGNITHLLGLKQDITEQRQIEQAEREQRAFSEALRDTAATLNSTLDFEQVLDRILANIELVVPHDAANIMLVDQGSGVARVARAHGYERLASGLEHEILALHLPVMNVPNLLHMAETGQPTVVSDVGRSPDWVHVGQTQWVGSYAAAPIRVKGQAVGFLNLNSITPGFFTAAHAERLRAFADQAAVAIENARLYAESRTRAEHMATINRIGLATTSGLDMQQVLRTLLEQCRQALPVDAFYVAIYDEPNRMLYHPLFFDRGDYRTAAPRNIQVHPGLSGQVIAQRETLYLPDTLAPDISEKYQLVRTGGEPTRSYVGVPLVARDQVVGVISMQSYQPNAYTSEHIRMFETIATQAAIAIENARLFEETRQRNQRLALINEISVAINQPGDLNAVLQAAVDGLARVLKVTQAGLALFDETRQHLTLVAEHIPPGIPPGLGLELPIEGNLSMQRILDTKLPVAIEDIINDPLTAHVRDVMLQRHIQSILIVPLIVRDEVIGTIGCDAIDEPRQFTPEEIELAQTVANLIALRIEQARLFEAERVARQQAQRRAADLGGLYAVTRATSRSLATEDVLAQALTSALVALGFEAGLVALAEPDDPTRLRVMAERGLASAMIGQLVESSPHGALGEYVYTQHEIVVADDLDQEQSTALRSMTADIRKLGWRAYVGIPLLHQEQALGVMSLFARQPRAASLYDTALLASIGHQVATSVANAHLFQTTLNERSRLRALIESSRDGIILTGLDGRITVINAPALQLLRLTDQPENWLGQPLLDVIGGLRSDAPEAYYTMEGEWERIRTGNEPPAEGEVTVPPHAIRWQSLPVRVGVRPMGRLIVLRDMTDERAIEKLREDMTHTMVHDLRNPLTGISTSLGMMTSGMLGHLSPDQREIIEIAHHSAQKMLLLVNAILDVNRLESGRVPVEPEALSIPELLADAIHAQSTLAGEKSIRLVADVPASLPPAWADEKLIQRVLQNLVGNAIKFTLPGGTVCATARMEERAERPVLLVSVSDTGPGIPPEIASRLFQKFVTGSQDEAGSGLGLAFCKLAIEAHGERIWLESEPELGSGGATFTFSLPIAKPPESVGQPAWLSDEQQA